VIEVAERCGRSPTECSLSRAALTDQYYDAGGTYNSNLFPATNASVTGVGSDDNLASFGNNTLSYNYYVGTGTGGTNLGSAAPSAANTYTVVAHYTSNNSNYTDADSAAVTFSIGQATPTVSVTDAGGIYNQSPYAATATVAGLNEVPGFSLEGVTPTLTYYSGSTAAGTPLAGAPLLPGTHTVKAAFASSADYKAASATTTFTIQAPTTSIAPFITSSSGEAVGVPGQPLTDAFAVTGPTQGISFGINYGDGTSVTSPAGGPAIELDHLYGNVNANNWFFAGVNDVIKGKNKNDVVTTIN
jgi:hypothetical protein